MDLDNIKKLPKAMVFSVGGTPEPIVKSLLEHRPEFVSFLVSQETCQYAVAIVQEMSRRGEKFSSEMSLIDDPNSLLACYDKSREAIRRATAKGYSEGDIRVDYTGGTKNMTVALAFAAVNLGVSFSYVGSYERTKSGSGIPLAGTEQIFTSINPWQFYAREENIRIATLFNQYQYLAAKKLAEDLSRKEIFESCLYVKLCFLIEGFYQWDLFCHENAAQAFKKAGLKELSQCKLNWVASIAQKTSRIAQHLDDLVQASRNRSLSLIQILDLISNAQRRYLEGKIDDAVLRLYRALEMLAQERLLNSYGVNSSDVSADCIPYDLREQFIQKYRSEDGRIRIPQNAAFLLLAALEDDLGVRYNSHLKSIKNIQNSRNNSYLAHGIRSTNPRIYERFKALVDDLVGLAEQPLLTFPAMEIAETL